MIKKYIGDLTINYRWFLLLGICVVLFFMSFFVNILFRPVLAFTWVVFFFTLVDYVLLFLLKGKVNMLRTVEPRFEIGTQNNVSLFLENTFPFVLSCSIIDEIPFQFQERDFSLKISIPYQSRQSASYSLKPLSRGEYSFGAVHCYASSPLGLVQRKFTHYKPETVKVYPAFRLLKKYQLQSLGTNDQFMPGLKKLRRLGHSLEFEKIKEYVHGDDVRTINWKATARSGNLMVNTFTDARQQQIYCVIDKGRNMKMPFEGMTLLDYSINAALALLNMALLKQDKAGLITFSNKISDIIPADRRGDQLPRILDTLYKQQTEFKESDYEAVRILIHKRINQRSLILFFTNFETFSSLERQLPYLKKIAQNHLTCVIFFQNTLLKQITDVTPDNIEGIYIKTIAEQFAFEKRQIVKELRRHGILSILTTPQHLTIDVINKYLEMKARQMV